MREWTWPVGPVNPGDRKTEGKAMRKATVVTIALCAVAFIVVIRHAARAGAQAVGQGPSSARSDTMHMAGMADEAMGGAMDENMRRHMRLTPARPATHADSVRATELAAQIRRAILKYRDTTAAVAAGYKMFLPNVKQQKVFHFTNYGRAFLEAFRFDPAKPTSLLYSRGSDGTLHLVGAMYTLPKRASFGRLDARVPLGIAHWHQHVDWCLPGKGEAQRFMETRNGKPLFGPESPIDTKAACDAVGGVFHDVLGGWMIHANVMEGTDLATIWGDDHGEAHAHPM